MRWSRWMSAAVGAMVGVLAAVGVAAVQSPSAQALSVQCQIGNDTDVAFAGAYGVTAAVSTIEMRACQSGKGSRVRIDYRIRNLDPQQPIFVKVTAPDGSVRQLRDRTVPGSADFAESQRWTTQATSSKGTWTLTVASLGANAILDSWKVWVIPGSCWRVNDDDVTSPAEWREPTNATSQYGPIVLWHPPTPVSTSVWSACTEFASADMRVRVLLRDVYKYEHHQPQWRDQIKLYRDGVEIATTTLSTTVTAEDGDYQRQDILLGVDGSSLRAAGTWTLEVRTAAAPGPEPIRSITMERWELHTSY